MIYFFEQKRCFSAPFLSSVKNTGDLCPETSMSSCGFFGLISGRRLVNSNRKSKKGSIEMKKTISVILAIVLCVGLLAGCSSGGSNAAHSNSAAAARSPATPPYTASRP
jgi:hypothetical protein